MFRLLETIRIDNGKLINIPYHESRIDRSLKMLYGERELPPIKDLINISSNMNSRIAKCSMLYSNSEYRITIQAYHKKKITSLLLIERPDIQYNLKYSNRSLFDNILPSGILNSEIIFTRKGSLTDTRYTNIALERDGVWITPQIPLLEGTQRAFLLDKNIIHPGEIGRDDLHSFSRIRLFNAMMPWEDCIELDITKIKSYD